MKFPFEALNQHIAILGKTGSGKTYTAKGLVEHVLGEGRRVCIIDPTGAWWGLRSSADGAAAGFPVVILGGSHGDTGLPGESGAACAQLVAEQSGQVIFDTSLMGVNERTRWFAAFGHELFRRNTRPLHLVIDEAHMFAPQGKVPDPDTGKMLHAANTLASGGRSRGIRMMMITQRPAKLHKDSLTCCDTLIAMRVIAPQDREAIEDWVLGAGDKAQSNAVLSSLAQLPKGEGWVWAPEIGFLERFKFPKIRTFDSSKTPEDGDAAPAPKTLAEIDLSAITATMTTAVEEAKANDPKVLRAEIAELKKKLQHELGKPLTIHADKRIDELEQQLADARKDAEHRYKTYVDLWQRVDDWRRELARRLGLIDLDTDETLDEFEMPPGHSKEWPPYFTNGRLEESQSTERKLEELRAIAPGLRFRVNGSHHALEREAPRREAMPVGDSAGRQTPTSGPAETLPADERRAPAARAHTRQPPGESAPGAAASSSDILTGPQQRVIDSIAWWYRFRGEAPTRIQVAHMAGYSPTSGSWRNTLSEVRGLELIEDRDGGRLALTELGGKRSVKIAVPLTVSELQERIKDRLTGPQTKLFTVVVSRGKAMSRTEAAELAGYKATSGSFRNTCSELSSLGLVTYPNKTTIAAAPWVMGVKS